MTLTTIFLCGLLLGAALLLDVGALAVLLGDGLRGPEPAAQMQELACLTSREREVVTLIVDGLSSKQVARWLGISVHTVYNHRRSIYEKLDVHNAAALTRVVMERGMA